MRTCIATLLLLAIPWALTAAHVLAGNISYTRLSATSYQLELREYYDCEGLYGGLGVQDDQKLYLYYGNDFAREVTLSLDSLQSYDPPQGCVEFPETACIVVLLYAATVNFPNGLPVEKISLVREYCCRDETITNTVATDWAIYLTELYTGTTINSSPQFVDTASYFVCANEPFELFLGGADPDGDQLIYSYYAPFTKSGGTGCAASGSPNPCPPPYVSTSYTSGYTSIAPLGSGSEQIDPNTGLITGQIDLQGNYLMGVRVDEYRNGVLIGTVYRDIMLTVVSCSNPFKAILPAPRIEGVYQYASCGDTTLRFANGSTAASLDSFVWQFSHGEEIAAWVPTVSFPGYGSYTGRFILNPGQECTDTALLAIELHPSPTADFQSTYDPCVAGPVAYYDRSTGGTPPYSHAWQLGDGLIDSIADPVAQYTAPGIFPVALAVADANGCADTLTRPVDYRPAPAVLVVAPDVRAGCVPLAVTFQDRSLPVDSTYTLDWAFGDGTVGAGRDPSHTYADTGVYDVALRIESPLGCLIDTVFRELVAVRSVPAAGFAVEGTPTGLDPVVRLTADAPSYPRHVWRLDGAVVGEGPELELTLPDTGSYALSLTVTNEVYCQQTAERIVRVAPAATFHLPNAFTPNGDGDNDLFRGRGLTDQLDDFELSVYDRHGGEVWRSTDPTAGWDGRRAGRALPGGVYVWRLRYAVGERRISETGQVLLLR